MAHEGQEELHLLGSPVVWDGTGKHAPAVWTGHDRAHGDGDDTMLDSKLDLYRCDEGPWRLQHMIFY